MQRNFLRGLLICLVPCALLGAAAVFGTYRPGIDLAGGTILVYEIDLEKTQRRQEIGSDGPLYGDVRQGLGSEEMQRLAEALKRRIDPVDTKNVIIRPVGESRVEILIPFTPTSKKEAGTEDFVQFVKDVVSRVGVLEFRILANETDDAEGIREAEDAINSRAETDVLKEAKAGIPPPGPSRSDFKVSVNSVDAEDVRYVWVELSKQERDAMGLSNTAAKESVLGQRLAANRNKTLRVTDDLFPGRGSPIGSTLIYSRDFKKENPPIEEKGKEVEYYVLTRVSDLDQLRVGGDVTLTASPDSQNMKWVVNFRFNSVGDQKFGAMTSRNRPTSGMPKRHLAILLDDRIVSAPSLNSEIRGGGQISGDFKKDYVDKLVYILRSGALTAELKPNPVSENFVGPTLGQDTINKGLTSVAIAFGAVMIFMMVYYRLAGVIACVALMANLVLTVGFMVSVNAAFTLAGLAGIVLMLGMAVDANVLIYERLREEREKGATLIAAIRSGYDRALPTIIDTHVSSIFTAIVLFIFGNDNLKGFAVSLTVGLVISLFTSLYMTRLVFDFLLSRRWMTNYNPMKLFSRPNLSFMSIRKQMFALTAMFTLVGLGFFLYRGQDGLNVDFRGGTVYGGRLSEALPLAGDSAQPGLLDLLSEKEQLAKLKVEEVTAVATATDAPGARSTAGENTYRIYYVNQAMPVVVTFANKPAGDTDEARLKTIAERASRLPDISVEQVRLSRDNEEGNKSKLFTVRTTEKEKELVQVMLDRLLRSPTGESLFASTKLESSSTVNGIVTLNFSAPTSVAYVQNLVKREVQLLNREPQVGAPFFLEGVAAPDDTPERNEQVRTGKYTQMKLDVTKNESFQALADAVKTEAAAASAAAVVGAVAQAVAQSPQAAEDRDALGRLVENFKSTFEARPVPERLETFDATLATDTQAKALYAIVASWIAILLYLWFRFGSWTFGLAAVCCLIHDLCFTLGAIAVCHYLYAVPVLGSGLLLQDFKIDLATVAALLTLVGYSVNDTIVVFDRIREVRGKNPLLTEKMINDSVNQTLSRTVLASLTVFLVVAVLYLFGGEGVHLFSFVMVIGVVVGTYSSIYIASPLLLFFGEGQPKPELTPSKAPALSRKA